MKKYKAEIRHFHLFCGLGGGAAGFNAARSRAGGMTGTFRCIGGVDVDPASIADFKRLTGVEGTVLDLFDRDQYIAFHGAQPPVLWREAASGDIRAAAGGEYPNIVFLSAPCKGFSGLLSEAKSKSGKYQALNRLTLRGIWLMLEAFKTELPELIIFENVPRIATRGRKLLDQIVALLSAHGYAVAETKHNCGELGALAQSRERFLLVARHERKVKPFLYVPQKHKLRAVGEVLDKLPLPGDPVAGPMHRIPRLSWKTWVRLAFVTPGGDWRTLNRLRVENGHLKDYFLLTEGLYNCAYGVTPWNKPSNTVTSKNQPTTGVRSVEDPRFKGHAYGQYGVREWSKPTGTIAGQQSPGQGGYAVEDPRFNGGKNTHTNLYRIVRYDEAARTVVGAGHVAGGALAVQDVRPPQSREGFKKYQITPYDGASRAVIGASTTGQGAFAIADPRPGMAEGRTHYITAGHYGVVPMDAPSGAVIGSACHDNGNWSVADHRLPAPDEKLVAIIITEAGAWHRPFTTLELAALQGLFAPEDHFQRNADGSWECVKPFELEGKSDGAWRERIGNAVPPPAAAAIAGKMGKTLLTAWKGGSIQLEFGRIWVRRPLRIG